MVKLTKSLLSKIKKKLITILKFRMPMRVPKWGGGEGSILTIFNVYKLPTSNFHLIIYQY